MLLASCDAAGSSSLEIFFPYDWIKLYDAYIIFVPWKDGLGFFWSMILVGILTNKCTR